MISNPVFICGCGHSGTSLIANMFANHHEVFIPLRETGTFLKEEEINERLHSLEREFNESGKKILFEKTPRHLCCLNRIRLLTRSPRFIIMVRDGRDVAASFIKRYGNAMLGAERWLKENAIAVGELEAPDTYLIRYEDLIDCPERILHSACDFLGMPYDPSMIDYHKTQRLWFGASDLTKGNGKAGIGHIQLRNWQINQPIFDGRGQWRELLSPDEICFFEREKVKSLMIRFDYR